MIIVLIEVLEVIIFVVIACSVAYVAFFAIAGACKGKEEDEQDESTSYRYLVLFPAYAEDAVIVSSIRSFLKQDYPSDSYHVVVISDHNSIATNGALSALPVTLLTPSFEHSTKGAALQYAMSNERIAAASHHYDYVVILDADNVVETDFLRRLSGVCSHGYKAVQCHRTAKNRDNEVSLLDAVSEEINNTIFRSAHNAIGLSSSLIGSGLCIAYDWFDAHVGNLLTAGEDRELETMLLTDRIFIRYEASVPVYDEKVSDAKTFSQQRRRWLSAQLHSLLTMLPALPHAVRTRNIDFIDKTIQQALIPRSMLIAMTAFFTLLITVITIINAVNTLPTQESANSSLFPLLPSLVRWWALLIILLLSLRLAIPKELRRWSLVTHAVTASKLTLRMFGSASRVSKSNKVFIHTEHKH